MYTHERRVTYSEVSMNGYADAAQIADYFQDCSCFQSDNLGVGIEHLEKEHLSWLLASWQIVIERYPVYGETIYVSTWPYGFDSAFGYRNFMIQDGKGQRLAVANSQWILVNTLTGHPTKITEAVICQYPIETKADMMYAPRKIPFRDIQEAKGCLYVPGAVIDTNHHVNNAQYIRMALEYVPETFPVGQVRVEFKKAAVRGDAIYPYVSANETIIKVLLADSSRKPYATVEFVKLGEGEKND